MRRSALAAVLLFGCGTSAEVVRPTDDVVYLKLKGDVARQLFEDLEGAPEPMACPASERPCKRRGESLICSTANVRDEHVCEVRFDAVGGGILAPRDELYHSAADDRLPVVSARDGDRIVLSGEGAAELLRRFAGGPGEDGREEVEIEVVDPALGNLLPLDW